MTHPAHAVLCAVLAAVPGRLPAAPGRLAHHPAVLGLAPELAVVVLMVITGTDAREVMPGEVVTPRDMPRLAEGNPRQAPSDNWVTGLEVKRLLLENKGSWGWL